jgi:hypothetical protein
MIDLNIKENIIKIEKQIFWSIENFLLEKWPDIFWAFIILVIWFFISLLIYRGIVLLFKKFKIMELIDKLDIDFGDDEKSTHSVSPKGRGVAADLLNKEIKQRKKFSEVFWKKIKIDKVVAKASSYYVFLLFFRWSVTKFTNDVETFLDDLLSYLPSLFIWIFVLFFGIRFANFIYDVVYHSMNITKQKTLSKVLAMWAKIIILFFTLIVVLNYTKLVDQVIINTILTGFIAMLTIAWGLGNKKTCS